MFEFSRRRLSLALSKLLPAISTPSDEAIILAPNAKELARAWQNKTIATQCLTPGSARKRSDLRIPCSEADAMISVGAVGWLSKALGPDAGTVDGKYKNAKCYALDFKKHSILAIAEPDRGVSWEMVLGTAADPEAEGRSYGRYVLLSCDKEVVDFWPDLCHLLGKAMMGDPLAFKAQREAENLDAAVSISKSSKPAARM